MQGLVTKLKLSQRLARTLRDSIESGQLSPGSRLPTTRELAGKYEVSLNTVQSAFRELEALDLIECEPRRRGYVKTPTSGEGPVGLGQIAVISELAVEGTFDPSDNWLPRITKAAERVFVGSDHHLNLLTFDPKMPGFKEKLFSRVERMAAHLGGAILFSDDLEDRALPDLLDERKIPWVSINPLNKHETQNFVAADNLECGRIVGRCFARLGYRRVLLLYGTIAGNVPDVKRMTGFIEGYIESDVSFSGVDRLCCEDWNESAGYEKTLAYLDAHEPPQGIFTMGDLLALGATRACRERGLDVPDKVGVVGSSGLTLGKYSHPPLTVIAQPMERIGTRAAEMLLEMIRKGIRRMPSRRFPGKFILRDSLRLDDELRREIESGGFG